MVHAKVRARQLTLMEVFMKVNGKMIKNMEQEFFNTLMGQNMTDNGKMISDMDLEHTSILMAINIKEIGIMTFNKVWVPITIQMVTFTRANGLRESPTVKETIFIKAARQFIKATGHKVKSKVLGS